MVKHVKLSEKISDDDRISELPEPILHHILSFLSTKQAATTSVLSKSWQYQWTWLPNLYISQREMSANDITRFGTIILKIFLSRRARCIRKLYLSCMSDDSDLIIGSILCTSVERNVEDLDLYTGKLFELPTRLFCCKTLVALTLRGRIVMDIGSSPVHLPSLKDLHLQRVKYKDENTFRNLLGGCPVLDYLAVGFVPDDDRHYEIFSLSVRHVSLRIACFNNPSLLSKITVSAPALEQFTIDVPPTALVLNNVSSSVRAKFHILLLRLSSRDKYWDTMKVIFGALCNVQFLELIFGYSTVSGHDIPIAIFPRFDNLIELKLLSYCCSFPLLSMLLKCSRLEHLTLVSKTSKRCPWENPKCWISPQQVPNCLAFHLTTVKFEGFEGLEAEVGFTQYVLNNSKVLRSVTIRYENNTNLERKFRAFQKISGFVKQSTRCQLTFQPQI